MRGASPQASLTAAGARWGLALVSAEILRCPSSSPSVSSLLPRSRYPPWRRLMHRSPFIVEDRLPLLRGIAAIATRKDIIAAVVQAEFFVISQFARGG